MTLTRTQTTDPFDGGEGGSYRTWWVADGPRMVALSVQHHPDGPPVWMPTSAPSVRIGNGVYALDGFYEHRPAAGWRGDGCKFHDNCAPSAVSGRVFAEAWSRLAAADVTDDVVYAELEQLHGEIFAEVAR